MERKKPQMNSIERKIPKKCSPAKRFPLSAACPLTKIVLTKIPMLPFGESFPPTIEKPNDFIPAPL